VRLTNIEKWLIKAVQRSRKLWFNPSYPFASATFMFIALFVMFATLSVRKLLLYDAAKTCFKLTLNHLPVGGISVYIHASIGNRLP